MSISFNDTTDLSTLGFSRRRKRLEKLKIGTHIIYNINEDTDTLLLAKVVSNSFGSSMQVRDVKPLGKMLGAKVYNDEFGIRVPFNDVEHIVDDLPAFVDANAEYFV